jgi:hypothetical protein
MPGDSGLADSLLQQDERYGFIHTSLTAKVQLDICPNRPPAYCRCMVRHNKAGRRARWAGHYLFTVGPIIILHPLLYRLIDNFYIVYYCILN